MFRSNIIRVLLLSACSISFSLYPAACKVTGSPKDTLTDHQITTIIKNYIAAHPQAGGIVAVDQATKAGKCHFLELISGELAANDIALTQLPHLVTVLKKHHKQANDREFAIKLLNNTICALRL